MKNKKYIRFAVLVLMVCMMLALAPASVVSGLTAEQIQARIDEIERKAAELELRNQEREHEIAEMEGDIAQARQRVRLMEQSIAEVNERIALLNERIVLKQEAIANKQADIETLEARIEDAEREIVLREHKISLLEAENEENLAKFGQLVRNNYMTGSLGMVDILLDSGDFYDMIVRADVLQKAAERNTDFMNDLLAAMRAQEREIEELEELKLMLNADRELCEREKADLEDDLAALNVSMKELDEEMDEAQARLRILAGEESVLQNTISGMYRQFNATNEELEELDRQTTQLIKELQNLNRPNYSGDGFVWPLDERFQRITCGFGWDAAWSRWHRAIDVGNSGINGANIYAIQSGTVIVAVESNSRSGYGSYVVVDHGGGYTSLYSHMQFGSVRVSVGQEVTVGQVLGLVGSTGLSTGPHLHFEIRVNGEARNPLDYSFSFVG
ncbi:MAG: peptidoglycan DD-metalloendopeptidase family protein [Oscillospiraceae bacterium]|jgi:murein DD-endopeptidase MepM/ murein hydrolase activator NlpD|nr:peptidoglycan DD-metalloendopeptidase family protein [Oscillospiraceae bacterium]